MKTENNKNSIWVRREYQCVNGHTWNVVSKREEKILNNCPHCNGEIPFCSEDDLIDLPFITLESAASINKRNGKIEGENMYVVVVHHPSIKDSYRTRFFYPWIEAVKLADQIRKMPLEKALRFLKAGVGK